MRISDWSSDVCSSDLHGDRDDDSGEPVRCRNQRALVEDRRRIGVEGEPPPEEGRRRIDRIIAEAEPRVAKLGLERSEEHTSELQSLMRNSYAVFCLQKKKRAQE